MTIRSQTLANGFTIATEYMPNFKTAALGIWIKVGGRHETKEQNGIAHFLEHMAFKGTSSRTSFQIAQAIENVGGYINAYTSREITNYYCRVLSEDVPLAMDVISDIVLNTSTKSLFLKAAMAADPVSPEVAATTVALKFFFRKILLNI